MNLWRELPRFLRVLIAILAFLYLLYQLTFPETIIRYRLTATFKVGEKISTGSGVLQVRYQPQPCFDVCGINAKLNGQAIPIDFGEGVGTLWILLRGGSGSAGLIDTNDPAWLVPAHFGVPVGGGNRALYVWRIRFRWFAGRKELALDQLPQLLMLPDDGIPDVPWKTDPVHLRHGDVKPEFVSAEIETTDDPITTGIAERLPWLVVRPNQPRPRFIGNLGPNDFWRPCYDKSC